MVVKCCVTSYILKNKIITVFIAFTLIFGLSNFLQVSHKLFAHVEPKYLFDEPIDVVYTWVNGSDPKFIQSLHEYLQINSTATQDYSNQRFDDKYELKFSLRSLEKYAPWIHHVYIVTNGQIPYWLNLDYEKVTLISHKDIFTDSFDLPTFSSPAIESHLHRIPGLSNRFIYFNDDIFLGRPIFMDDFVSSSRGVLIYLAWPLPMCAVDCPWVYVGDGQCDSACYNGNCQMDGGDCNIMNKIQNPWDENFMPFLNSNEIISSDFQGDDYVLNISRKNVSSHKPNDVKYLNFSVLNSTKYNQRYNKYDDANTKKYVNSSKVNLTSILRKKIAHYDRPKPLNNSKLALKLEPTLANLKLFLNRNITSNLTKIVRRHNKNVILHNKLSRRKHMARRYRNRDLSPGLNISNSTFVKKLRSSNANIDAYGASLQHSNRIYNLRYGFKSRYVPAHAPIMIDKSVMADLQEVFAKEFRKTSRNMVRSEDDMQFAFSYYYYLINEKKSLSVGEIFDRFDTDNSGTWSDREIRTILTKLYDLPLSYGTVDHFEDMLVNCSKYQTLADITTPQFERYVDSKLPTVSKELVSNCPVLSTILKDRFSSTHKYKYEIISNAQSTHVIFKMLSSNISEVVGHLDEIRRHTKKFVCLNDNMDEAKVGENELIRAVLYDFYLSLFPTPSKFELPTDFRNRFLYIDELNQWKSYHFKLKVCTYLCIFILCYLTYCNLFKRRILYRFVNKLFC